MTTPTQTESAAPTGSNPVRERSLGELIGSLTEQLSTLVRSEIQLAIAQATEKGKRLGAGAGLFVAAGVLGLYLFAVLLTAAILLLALVLPAWAAALIVAGVLLVVILILALVGKKQVDESKKFVPAPQQGLKEDLEAVKRGIQQ